MTTDETKEAPTIPAWAHKAGMLSLRDASAPADAAATADRLLFSERIARYCWAYDERQLDRLAACFTEDAVWEGNVIGKIPVGPFAGRDAICNWLSEFWPHQRDQRRHMILNTIVEEQTPDSAVTWSYLLLMGSTGREVSVETTGFYRVHYRRIGQDWLIARLVAGFDAPFWPRSLDKLSPRAKARHGVAEDATDSV